MKISHRKANSKEGEGQDPLEASAIKAHDDSVYYAGIYWNDYPQVARAINERISGDHKTDWFKHFQTSQKGRVFKKALIINCGNGWVERKFYRKGLFKEAVGVDYSENLLKEAKQKAKKMPFRYYQMDINEAKFPETGFDLVINNAAGHHIAYIHKVFGGIAANMTKDGVFVNLDYVGPHRNQYPLLQWLAAHHINRKLPEHMRQEMNYPHHPTMVVTDPSEAIHSERVIPTTKKHFKIKERKKMGGGIAYLLLTHNKNFQKASKNDVLKWTRYILQKDKKFMRFLPRRGSMFDYWVAEPKRKRLIHRVTEYWHTRREELREVRANESGGVYYRFRPKIMQRITVGKENKRLEKLKRQGEKTRLEEMMEKLEDLRKQWRLVRSWSLRHLIYKVLVADTQKQSLRFFRFVLVGSIGLMVSLATALMLLRYWHAHFRYAASAALAAGIGATLIISSVLAFPSKSLRFLKARKHALAALILCVGFFSLGTFTLAQGTTLSKDRGVPITFDEVSLLPNGYYYQQNGKYFLNPEHPPLVNDVAAWPMKSMDLKQPKEKERSVLLQDYAQYLWGKEFLFESQNDTERVIFRARRSVLLVNAALLFVLYLSLAKAWSKRSALIALFLITVSQFSLAHAMLALVDFMAAILTILALIWRLGQ